jgi:hypothetical protein
MRSLDDDPLVTSTPIVASSKDEGVPTSSAVHLYADPKTLDKETPILLADCEGLRGGNREPKADAAWKKFKESIELLHQEDRIAPPQSRYDKLLHFGLKAFVKYTAARNVRQEREVSWDSKEKMTRQYAVENIYPRLLYAFSDTIVFVTKNPKKVISIFNCSVLTLNRVVESVIEQLIDWAEAGLEHSSNQAMLPYAIIVFNSVDNVSLVYSPSSPFHSN